MVKGRGDPIYTVPMSLVLVEVEWSRSPRTGEPETGSQGDETSSVVKGGVKDLTVEIHHFMPLTQGSSL